MDEWDEIVSNPATIRESSERYLLDEFWRRAMLPETDRLMLLGAIGGIAISRPSTWDKAQVRAEANRLSAATVLVEAKCFSCRTADRELHRHHIVWVDHGGSNRARNFVPLCRRCHCEVHGWEIPETTPNGIPSTAGMVSIGDIAGAMLLPQRKKESA